MAHRRTLHGLRWIDRTGAPWRALPERYGPWATVATRFYRWCKSGRWERIRAALQTQAAAAGALDREAHDVDGTVSRAHQQAAGAQGGARMPRRSAAPQAAPAPQSLCAPKVGGDR